MFNFYYFMIKNHICANKSNTHTHTYSFYSFFDKWTHTNISTSLTIFPIVFPRNNTNEIPHHRSVTKEPMLSKEPYKWRHNVFFFFFMIKKSFIQQRETTTILMLKNLQPIYIYIYIFFFFLKVWLPLQTRPNIWNLMSRIWIPNHIHVPPQNPL